MSYLKRITPIILLTSLLLVVFGPSLVGGTFIDTGMFYCDLMLFNLPLKDWYRELLINGQLPFWTSFLGNGYPLFAEGQIGALYPPHLLLFRFLPTLLAFNLNLFLHFLVAAIFTFGFCRVSLKTSALASILAGLAYSLSGFFLIRLQQTNIVLVVSYLPLTFLLIDRLVKAPRLLWAFALAVIFAFQILAGFVQMFYYTSLAGLLFFTLLFLVRGQESSLGKRASFKKSLFLLASAFFFGIGIAAVQIFSTWELTKFSHRASGLNFEASVGNVWPLKALSLFANPKALDIFLPAPDYHPLKDPQVFTTLYGYVGIMTLILAILAIFSRWRNRWVIIFTSLAALAFLFGIGRSTQLFSILWSVVPGMKFFREPVKILFLIEFCLAVLAACGFDALLDFIGKKKPRLKTALPWLGAVLIVFTFVDLYFNNVRLQPIIESKSWFATPVAASFLQEELKGPDFRFYTSGTDNLDIHLFRDLKIQKELQNSLVPDFNLLYRIPSSQSLSALFLTGLLNAEGPVLGAEKKTFYLTPMSKKIWSLESVKFLITNLPVEDEDFVLRKEIPFSHPINYYNFYYTSQGIKTVVVPAQATYIYENQKVYPRAVFATKSRTFEEEKQRLEAILKEDFDPQKEVILEKHVPFVEPQLLTPSQARVEIARDVENEMVVEVQTDSPGFLVLADTFYPGWQATVDNQPAEIYRANYAFRAVPVGGGKHLVKFAFEPTYWRLGLGISVVALVIVLLGLGYSLWRKI